MNQLAFKEGVVLTSRHFDDCMAPIWRALLEKFPKTDDGKIWITTAREERDSGLHPHDRALDIRTHNLFVGLEIDGERRKKNLEMLAQALRARLGPGYDVLLEDAGTPNEHIHIECDPNQWGR